MHINNQKKWIETLIISSIFLAVSIVGILHHEPWRDEIQAWLIALHSHSIAELYNNCLYEGHPMLWHLLLYAVSSISDNIAGMQVLSVCITTTSVFLFYQYSPFSRIQKILFSFGYLTLFQYNIVSRSYGLVLLFSILFLIWFSSQQQNKWGWIILFLLANVSASGIVLSLTFISLHLLRNWDNYQFKINIFTLLQKNWGFIFFTFLGILLSAWQILPEKNNTIGGDFSISRFIQTWSTIFDAYTWMQYWPEINNWSGVFWNQSTTILGVTSILLFVLCCLLLSVNYLAIFCYTIGTLGIALLLSTTMMISARFIGHFFIVLIASFWIVNSKKKHPTLQINKKLVIDHIDIFRTSFLNLVLTCQFATGVWVYAIDIRKSFSKIQEVASFIKHSPHGNLPITGILDYTISPLSYYLAKNIFYVETQSYGNFIKWNTQRRGSINPETLNSTCDFLMQKNAGVVVVLSTFLPTAVNLFTSLNADSLGDSKIHFTLLQKFEGALVKDENFYVYLAKSTKQTDDK